MNVDVICTPVSSLQEPQKAGMDTNVSSLNICSSRWHASRWVLCPRSLGVSMCLGIASPHCFPSFQRLCFLMMIAIFLLIVNLQLPVQPTSHVHLALSSFFSLTQKHLTYQFTLSRHHLLFLCKQPLLWTISMSRLLFQALLCNLTQFLHHHSSCCYFTIKGAEAQV